MWRGLNALAHRLRRTAERARGDAHWIAEVTYPTDAGRARDRAARLHDEALNCLTFAVSEGDRTHAAALIDEALRLAQRSRELRSG